MFSKFIFLTSLFLIIFSLELFSQTKTEETRRTVDSATGEIKVTKSEIISRTEDITPINNIITINPLKFFILYNLTYYYKLNNITVLGAGLQMPTISEVNGVGINAEVRFHPSKKAPRGFYIAPNVSYNSLGADVIFNDNTSSSVSASSYSVGVLVGWQWFPSDDFAIGLGIGLDRYFLSGSENESSFSKYNGTIPALRFDIGYAW